MSNEQLTLREKINRNAGLVGGISAVLVVIAIGVFIWQSMPEGVAKLETQAFYTIDDGKTFFKDSIYHVSPWDKDGQKAYRCGVYKSKDGDEFVGVIYRHNQQGRALIEQYVNEKPEDEDGQKLRTLEILCLEVRKPGHGDKTWVLANDTAGTNMIDGVKGKDGQPAAEVKP